MAPNFALLSIDWINEIADPAGKLAGKGYADFIKRHSVLDRVETAHHMVRESTGKLMHVRVGFSSGYPEHPAGSPLFGKAKEFGALALGGWGTEFVKPASPRDGEVVLVKHRVNAFHATALDAVLRNQKITHVAISGVATDLAVEAAARAAHDLDYDVFVVADCCAAACDDDHDRSLATIQKIARVISLDELATLM
jgi:nicotinamidase-related amidase